MHPEELAPVGYQYGSVSVLNQSRVCYSRSRHRDVRNRIHWSFLDDPKSNLDGSGFMAQTWWSRQLFTLHGSVNSFSHNLRHSTFLFPALVSPSGKRR